MMLVLCRALSPGRWPGSTTPTRRHSLTKRTTVFKRLVNTSIHGGQQEPIGSIRYDSITPRAPLTWRPLVSGLFWVLSRLSVSYTFPCSPGRLQLTVMLLFMWHKLSSLPTLVTWFPLIGSMNGMAPEQYVWHVSQRRRHWRAGKQTGHYSSDNLRWNKVSDWIADNNNEI